MIDSVLQQMGYTLKRIKLYNSDVLPDPEIINYLIVLGGLMHMEDEDQYPWLVKEKKLIKATIDAGKPVLGICLGAQLIAYILVESVYPAEQQEIGWYPIEVTEAVKEHELTSSWGSHPTVFHWYSNTFDLPEGATPSGLNGCVCKPGIYTQRNIIGLQFHLEIARPQVRRMIDNWGLYNENGPYIQESEEMLEQSDASERTQKMQQLMEFWIE